LSALQLVSPIAQPYRLFEYHSLVGDGLRPSLTPSTGIEFSIDFTVFQFALFRGKTKNPANFWTKAGFQ
jgi:hypothetical protein